MKRLAQPRSIFCSQMFLNTFSIRSNTCYLFTPFKGHVQSGDSPNCAKHSLNSLQTDLTGHYFTVFGLLGKIFFTSCEGGDQGRGGVLQGFGIRVLGTTCLAGIEDQGFGRTCLAEVFGLTQLRWQRMSGGTSTLATSQTQSQTLAENQKSSACNKINTSDPFYIDCDFI